jgi:hypothetical protein
MEVQTAAVKSIAAAMETEVGRKIIASRMITLSADNRSLKRKVAEDRIAVHALNELAIRLTKLINGTKSHMDANGMVADEKLLSLVNSVKFYHTEAFGDEMSIRIASILGDNTGDDLLLEELIGKTETDKA